MATAAAATAGPSALCSVNDDQKRWMVFGIALNKVLVEQIRPFVEKEVNKEYGKLKISHGIHAQSTAGRLTHWPSFLKYENINGNDTLPKVHGKYNNYSVFDCRVTSHLDFAKLYVENFMAKFNAFDEHCDASAVLTLLSKVQVFSVAVQSAAGDVRQARNAWAHCAFSDWDPVKFTQSFDVMEHLVKALGLPAPDERTLLGELKDWETKGTLLCMNTPVDPALLQLVQHHVNALKTDVDKLTFDVEDERDAVKKALSEVGVHLEELENRVSTVEQDVKHVQDEQSDIKEKIDSLTSGQENLRERVTQVEGKRSFAIPQISSEISSCEADVAFFAERHDADTRQWLFEDFNKWFRDPGNSRAYVLLGDAGVGKSVMAGALARRTKKAGQLGAAYFCRHNDGTRNDPRYILGTVACQLSECNREYSNLVGGEGGVRMMLANSKLGVLELFTKLLQEPLAKCNPCEQRNLVIIDALDETEYQSREDFLDLVMHRFPLLPKWLVFFITSRPEDTVQFRLKKYNPCIKICAGDSEHVDFYHQHERDIRKYLEKKLDFSRLAFSLEDVTAKCNGLFLYAHYIVEVLNDPVHSGKISHLNDLFPGDIEEFFRENFKRVFDKVGGDLYRKLFGCVIAAPSPLPLSFISFLLERENLNLDEQEVIDAVSQFVVHRTSDQTFAFLHGLIPSWLTDKKKSSRKLSIDRVEAGEYFKDIILGLLPGIVNDQSKRSPSVESDLVDYVLRNGVRVLCGYDEKASLDIVFSCLTSYQFIQRRMQTSPIEIYSVVGDLNLSARCQALGDTDREILQEMWTVLESNIHSLLQCPHLLLSVLRNASKALQCKLAIPDGVSATWLEWNGLSFPVYEIPRDMSCFALSPDKMLLAGGKDQSISLFDACSLEKMLGPVTVLESTNSVNHLEFSPDGKFVFFGRLDRLFFVERGCVQEFPQFSGATIGTYYRWGSFVSNGRYLVVERSPYTRRHTMGCTADVLFMWATQEVNQIQGDEIVSSRALGRSFEEFRNVLEAFDLPVVVTGKQQRDWYATLKKLSKVVIRFEELCKDCLRFKYAHQQLTLAIVRQRVIDLYDDIFQHQVWNVQSGNNLLDEVFSSSVELSPFLFLCHLPRFVFQECETLFCDVSKSMSPCVIALMNTVSIMRVITRGFTLSTRMVESSESLTIKSFIPRNVTKEFYDRIRCHGRYLLVERETKCSPDKKWMAVRGANETRSVEVKLFRGTNQEDKHIVVFEHAHVYVIKKVKDFDFTRNSKVIVYVTNDELLQALSLETGSILSSVSGLSPLYYTPKQQVGYVFRSSHEETNIFLNDFPTGLLKLSSLPFDVAPVGVTFTSETGIKSVFKDARVTSWTISDSDVSRAVVSEWRLVKKDQEHHYRKLVKRCAFSLGGKLIAIHYLSEIRFLREFKPNIVVFRESKEEGDWNISWLTFSADGTFLLYCIQRINDYAEASVHVWDVQKETFVAFCPQRKLIDCGYLSSNNSKLVICGELSVQILEFDLSNRRFDLLARLELGRLCIYSEFEKFSCCTVSSDNKLLACCIADGIHLYPLCAPTQQSLRQLPHGHLGRIEFCQFLKGTRYLTSYGVDGSVFLWDLSEWKAVAYARIVHGRESIVSLDVSPEEDRVVCLTSFNRFIIIKLHGLISGATPLAFLSVGVTGSQGLTRKTSRGQLQEQDMVPNEKQIKKDIDVDQLLEEMEFVLSSEDSEDSDEGESDVVLTD